MEALLTLIIVGGAVVLLVLVTSEVMIALVCAVIAQLAVNALCSARHRQ